MSFTDEIDSLKTKLHLRDIPAPLRVGLIILCAIILFILFQGLWQLGAGDTHLIEGSAQGSWEEEVSDADFEVRAAEEQGTSAQSEQENPKKLSVHVVGAVKNPGLYEVAEGSRVQEAIEAAGGMTDSAEQSSVNLARDLTDGEQVVVAAKGTSASQASSSAGESAGQSVQSGAGLVNINSADVAGLSSLSGVGEATAKKIIADREKNGPFKSKKDITRVSGIGEKKYEAIKDSITV